MTQLLETMAWNALEAALAAGAVAAACALWKLRAAFRHALWLIVLVKLLVPPVALHPLVLAEGCRAAARGIAAAVARATEEAPLPGAGDASWPQPLEEECAGGLDASFAAAPGAAAAPDPPPSFPPEPDPAGALDPAAAPVEEDGALGALAPAAMGPAVLDPPGLFPRVVFAVWLGGAAAAFLRRFREARALRLLLRAAAPAPPAVAAACRDLAARLGIRRPPPVRVLPGRASPFLAALGAPVVALPESLCVSGDGALRAVLAHELGHLKRGDRLAALLECAASIVYWWLPLLPAVRRELHSAADEAADARAAAALGSERRYAASLVEALDVLTTEPPPAACPGLGLGEREAIERRLLMILRQPLTAGLSWKCRLATVVLGLLILPAAREDARSQTAAPGGGATRSSDAIAAEEPAAAAAPEGAFGGTATARAAAPDHEPEAAPDPDDSRPEILDDAAPKPATLRGARAAAPTVQPATTPSRRQGRAPMAAIAGGVPADGRLEDVHDRLDRLAEELAELRASLGRPTVPGRAGAGPPGRSSMYGSGAPARSTPLMPGERRMMRIETGPEGEKYVTVQDDGTVEQFVDEPRDGLADHLGARGKALENWIGKELDLDEDQQEKFEGLQRDFEARRKEFQKMLADFEEAHRAALRSLLNAEQRRELDAYRSARRAYRSQAPSSKGSSRTSSTPGARGGGPGQPGDALRRADGSPYIPRSGAGRGIRALPGGVEPAQPAAN